jgi:6-phospho-3-hexuloisomerase
MAIKRFHFTFEAITRSLNQLQHELPFDQLIGFLRILQKAYSSNQRVFVYGLGRSQLVGKAFSMRLMHLGFHSYVIGETVTPAVEAHDVFLVISKTLSGNSVSAAIRAAQQLQAQIAIITTQHAHDLLQQATASIIIPDLKTHGVQLQEAALPLGTLFEVVTLVLLDSVVAELMQLLSIPEEVMATRHANIQE